MRRPGSLLLVLLLLAAGCSARPEPVTVTMTDFANQPEHIQLPADKPITIRLVNPDDVPHDFSIEELIDTPTPVHLALLPGGDVPLQLPALPAGTYTVFCGVVGHREQGMETTLVIT